VGWANLRSTWHHPNKGLLVCLWFVYAYSSWNGLVARHCECRNTKEFLEMKCVPALILTLALKQGRSGVGGGGGGGGVRVERF